MVKIKGRRVQKVEALPWLLRTSDRHDRMQLRQLSLILAVAMSVASIRAQPYYQRSMGSFVEDDGYAVAAMPDSGLVVGGTSYGFVTGANSSELYATRFSRAGDMLWSRHYDCGIASYALGLAATDSGGLVICGSDNGLDGVLFKVDDLGIPVWGWRSAIAERFVGVSISDSGMVYAAGSSSGSNADAVVEKFNGIGSLVWSRRYGTSYGDEVNCIAATSDGGAVLGGKTLTGGGEYDALLMNVDAAGALQWSRTIGPPGDFDAFNDVCECSAGGYLAVGSTYAFSYRPLVVRYDESGDTLWARRLGLLGGCCNTVEEVPGGYLIGGVVDGAYATPFIMLINEAGEVVWRKGFNAGDSQSGNGTAAKLADGSIALLGISWTLGPGMRDHLLVVTDENGMGADCESESTVPVPFPTEWQLTSFGAELGSSSCTPFLPVSASAGTLMETVCGDVPVVQYMAPSVSLVYEALSRTISASGYPAGSSLEVYDGLGRTIGTWSLPSTQGQVRLPFTATGIVHIKVLGAQGVVWSKKVAVMPEL